MADKVITMESVSKNYQDFAVLDIPKLELSTGIYWLKGENGAGKTTTMKVMAGLLPFRGEILLNGTVNSRRQPVQYRRLINYAEAEPLYPAYLTGRDLLELYFRTKGGDRAPVFAMATQMGVDNFVNNPVSSYSSGMLKKLSLVLAFVGNPAIILLDEPLITIDTKTLAQLYGIIQDSHSAGVSFIITSHQPLDSSQLTVAGTLTIENKNLILN
ncbi:ABC-2 type transport system ATP-binding protein [Chitinophaga jiangningensis]|uniref:ABC-2 type transport system ATP-binding protein n=1 Tax=Chitinophaga jiangningensis TaxID=1419482 RepID=A0A1M6V693_9BACT|nr:ATP-binding cassette domain-containing protein [Chitinophaga jiangningensis]SHK76915.1 ABC-2 type transport system ATP-binding protein [Chitinophaga jiangningensis]